MYKLCCVTFYQKMSDRTMFGRAFLTLVLCLFPLVSPAADEARAKEIVEEKCNLCHGFEGEASNAIYPRLAGQNERYIAKQLGDFKSGKRVGTMTEMVMDLTPDEMVALGKYFSAKPALSHKVRDPEFAAVGQYLFRNGNRYSGVAACKSCHGEKGEGSEKLPRLAGQHKRYLKGQLEDFHERKRTNDNAVMHTVASKLNAFEIEALSLYISGMK